MRLPALVLLLCAGLPACRSRPASQPDARPALPAPGGCEYDLREGRCHLDRHEVRQPGDGDGTTLVVRAVYLWNDYADAQPGTVEYRVPRDYAAQVEAFFEAHKDVTCRATVLVHGSCPPQASYVDRVDL